MRVREFLNDFDLVGLFGFCVGGNGKSNEERVRMTSRRKNEDAGYVIGELVVYYDL